MSLLEKKEGAAPWSASAPSIKNESSLFKNDDCTTPPHTSPESILPNAFLICPRKGAEKAVKAVKDEIKGFGCHWHSVGAWSCPIGERNAVERMLTGKQVGIEIRPIQDDYFKKNKNGQEADKVWTRIDILEQKYYSESEALIVDRRALEREVSSRELPTDAPEILDKWQEFEKREAAQKDLQEEIDQLRNSARLLEEKEDGADWDDPVPLQESLPHVDPFVEAMLPETLRPWIIDVAERMQVPLDFLAAACVIVLSSLIGRKIGIHPKAHDDWLVIPNLWGAVVGRPSLLKSPAIAEMMRPLDVLAAEALQKYKEEELLYEERKELFEAQKSARRDAMKQAAKGKKSTPIQVDPVMKPRLQRYKTEDGTVEKIGEILLENPQGLLIHRDELVGWLRSMDKQGREGDRAFYLEAWNGNGSFSVDRIGRGSLHIPALCLSVLGGIQPGPLSAYVHEATSGGSGDDGLLQRLQILVWPDPPKGWKNIDRTPNPAAKQQAFDVFRRLDAFAPFEPSSTQDLETYKVRFSKDAQYLFDEWRSYLEQRLRTEGIEPALESHLAKYRSLMPSLALIFYAVETIGNGLQISEVDMRAVKLAIHWCEYLETHARRLYASGEDLSMEAARSLLEHIKKGDLEDQFSVRDVYHARHWAKLNDAEKATKAIRILEEFSWVKAETVQTIGRPTIRVKIHPQLRKNFKGTEA